MNANKQNTAVIGRTLIALALFAAFTSARAQDDLANITQPSSSVSVGVSAASGDEGDRSIFGEFNGLRKNDNNLLLDIDYAKRDEKTGTWTILRGRDLGLDTPELGFTINRQGDWKFSADYEEIVKHSIRTINTGLLGAGTTTPTVSVLATPGTGQDVNLELKRHRLGLNFDKWINPSLQIQVSFKNEDKDGARLWAKGFTCGNIYGGGTWNGYGCTTLGGNQYAFLMLPEPVDSRTDQLEAKLNYSSGPLFLSAGYYGSFYTDNNGTVTPGGTVGPNYYPLYSATTPTAIDSGLAAVLGQPMALWPDNQAHQLYVDGTYAFTQKVRSTFNLSYTRATQDESFASMGLTGAPVGVSSLGAVVDTTRAQFGLTAQPMRKLSVVANLRYEDRADKTPVEYYNYEPPGTSPWTNSPISHHRLTGKLEGTYQVATNMRGTLGVDYESINRDLPVVTDELGGVTAVREKTQETSLRAGLRRAFSESFAGSINLVHSSRTGGDWYLASTKTTVSDAQLAATTTTGGALPVYLLDRKRDKARVTAEWTPSDRLSLQFVLEDGRDRFDAPIYTGVESADAKLYSLDASYAVSDNWKLTGYLSRSDQTMQVNQPNTGDYRMALRDLNDTLGIGLTGKASSRLDLGANLACIYDRNIYDQSMGPTASSGQAFLAASGGLPDVTFRETRLNLYGKYALDKRSSVRVDLVHQRDALNEWTWGYAGVPFNYADNSTVTLNPNQRVSLIMARYIYSFR